MAIIDRDVPSPDTLGVMPPIDEEATPVIDEATVASRFFIAEHQRLLNTWQAFGNLMILQDRYETQAGIPGPVSAEEIEDTKWLMHDHRVIFQRHASSLSARFAQAVPGHTADNPLQWCGNLYLTGTYYASRYEEGQQYALTDVISDCDVKRGIRLATQEHWREFLGDGLVVIEGQRSPG